MATILVGYDTETAAVGEALSLFTESPNFPSTSWRSTRGPAVTRSSC